MAKTIRYALNSDELTSNVKYVEVMPSGKVRFILLDGRIEPATEWTAAGCKRFEKLGIWKVVK